MLPRDIRFLLKWRKKLFGVSTRGCLLLSRGTLISTGVSAHGLQRVPNSQLAFPLGVPHRFPILPWSNDVAVQQSSLPHNTCTIAHTHTTQALLLFCYHNLFSIFRESSKIWVCVCPICRSKPFVELFNCPSSSSSPGIWYQTRY